MAEIPFGPGHLSSRSSADLTPMVRAVCFNLSLIDGKKDAEKYLMRQLFAPSLSVLMLFVVSFAALAGDFLTGEQIEDLVKGKTVHAQHLLKGFKFTVYFDSDGETAVRKENGVATETTYRVTGDKHCIFWNGKDRCASLRDNGDGTYTRVNARGKDVVVWKSFDHGKNL